MDEMAFFGLVYAAGMLLMTLQLLALVWVIYDVTTKQTRMSGIEKVLWIVLTFLFTILGALVYYLIVKRGRRYEEGEVDAREIRVY